MVPVQQKEVSEGETFGPLRRENETGLGPSAAMLSLGTPLLQQGNTEKLYGTKNNCAGIVRANSGRKQKRKHTKKPKNLTATSEEPGAKAGYCTCPHPHNTT